MSYEMNLSPDTRCWIQDPRQGWLAVNVTRVSFDDESKKYVIYLVSDSNPDEVYSIETDNFREDNKRLPQLRNLEDDLDDLTALSHLNEASVLNSTKVRYQKRKIYTYSGIVLVAINPFDNVESLYGYDIIKKYQDKSKSENQPHLFAIANEAYNIMKETGESQSIIVSGESGAGKTVSAKYIMRFFANANSLTTSQKILEIEKQILATNPIMEAFGNAKTIRNDNSSRFGKYLEIQFDQNSLISGANIKTYLLERSRLVYQPPLERNYHIFYQLLKGLSPELKKELGLGVAADYYYLNQSETSLIDGVDDAKEFKETCDALSLIGIDNDIQVQIFRILAALLHIGNIHIQKSRETATLSADDSSLLKACELLGLNPSEFAKWIIKKRISTRSDSIASNLKYHEAIVSRDSVAKYIYSSLFDWIADSINSDISTPNAEENVKTFIGVLDIYGFEHFDDNSFEQFCINYANEKLQQEFTQHVFKLQQEEYAREGIEWSFIEFSDNQPCINLIEGRGGILSLLDEQCQLPSGSENAWSEKMFHSLTQPPTNKVFKKERFGNEKFIVSHYALDVSYTIKGFLEKNRDAVTEAQNETLKNSENTFLLEILETAEHFNEKKLESKSRLTSSSSVLPSTGNTQIPGIRNTKRRKPTLGNIFKTSLIDLMFTINSTEVHYIRCIKPNESKAAWNFDNLMVLSQLRACGVLETIKISMVGFQSKCTYKEFLHRFIILLSYSKQAAYFKGGGDSIDEQKKNTSDILNSFIDNLDLYQMGKTKIFFKAGVLSELEIAKTNKVRDSVMVIQKYMRGYKAREDFKKVLGAIKLQAFFRGYLSRKRLQLKIQAILQIQALLRGVTTRRKFNESMNCLIGLQAFIIGNRTRKLVEAKMEKEKEEARIKAEIEQREKEEERLKIEKEIQEEIERQKKASEELKLQQQIEADELLRVKKLKQSHRKGVMNFENLSNESSDFVTDFDLPDVSFDTSHSSPNEFLSKNTEFSFLNLDYGSSFPTKKYHEPFSVKETKFFEENSPKEALELSATALVQKMEKISKSLSDFDGKMSALQMKTKDDFERHVFIYQHALERVDFDKDVRKSDKPKNQRRFSQISKRSSLISSSTGLKFSEEEARRNYQVSLLDMKSYMKGPSFMPQALASLLLRNLASLSEGETTLKNVLSSSISVIEILQTMWKLKLDGQSVIFLQCVVDIFQNEMASKTDPKDIIFYGTYLLNNMNEISKCLSSTRESLMYDLFSTKFGNSKRRSELMRLLLIVKRYFDAFFGVAYNSWMKVVIDELEKMTVDAVILDVTMVNFESDFDHHLKKLSNRESKYQMSDLIDVFSNVFQAMRKYFVDKPIVDCIAHDMLMFIDSLSFNNLITRENFLTVEKGGEFKHNISILIEWCHENHIPDSPDALLHLLTLCQILMLKKQGLADPVAIAKICDCLTVKQVQRILNECLFDENRDTFEQMTGEDYTIPMDIASFENAFIVQR